MTAPNPVEIPLPQRPGRSLATRGSALASLPRIVTFPTSFACTSVGALILVLGNNLGRVGSHWAELCFWAALILMFLVNAVFVVHPRVTERRRIGHLFMISAFSYLVKFYQSPIYFTNHDEYSHLRTLQDVLRTGRLFAPNPLLPVSSLHPGMEIASSALITLSGFSPFVVGVIVAFVARIIFIGALYLFFVQLTRSSQVAGMACLLYMGQANFVFFNAMFKYESLAIALMMLCLYWTIRAANSPANRGWNAAIAVIFALSTVVTHHLTSYILFGILLAWSAAGLLAKRRGISVWNPWPVALPLGVAIALWVAFVARQTITYLLPNFQDATTGVLQLAETELHLRKGAESRQLFADYSGHVSPLWERVMALASAGLLTAGLIFGLVMLYRQRGRLSVPALAWAVIGAIYPVTLLFRLAPQAWEVGNRSSEFIFVGLAFVVALGIAALLHRYAQPGWLTLAVTCGLCVVFLGGVISGWPPPWRVPGPYLPSSDTRSVENHGLELAAWARAYLPGDTIVGADRTNSDILATDAHLWPSSTLNGGVDVPFIIYSPHFGHEERGLLTRGRIHYLVVDNRLVRPPFASRTYLEFPHLTDAILRRAKHKFERLQSVDRIYDNGAIRVYDVSRVGSHS